MNRYNWITLAIVIACILAAAVAGFFMYRFYLANYGTITDSNNDEMNRDTSGAPDYRNSGIQDMGIINNNPGNLRPNGDAWHGMVGTNGGFLVFSNLWYGIRANVIDITTLIKDYGTVQAYISAYAPPSDNNPTEAYIEQICAATGLQRTDKVPLTYAMLTKLARAHFNIENGESVSTQYISDDDISEGILMITDALGAPLYPVAA